jgi:hypothetical protein
MEKNKLAIRCSVLFLALQILLPFQLFADTIGRFNELRGNVSLSRAKTILKPDAGDNIQTKDVVSTGDKSRAKLLLADDSLLSMGQNSKLEITEFLLDKNRRTSIISLRAGAVHAKVEKFLDPNSKFEVHTPTAITGARGTAWLTVIEFINGIEQVTVYALDQAIVVFNPALPTQIVIVPAGFSSTIVAGLAPTVPVAFTPEAIQGIMNQLGAQMPAGTGAGAGAGGTSGTGAGATGAGAGAGAGAGVVSGTAVGITVVGATVAAGIAAASSSTSGSTTAHTATSHH